MINSIIASFTISINNERVGYFKGGRGLRQGDPISPYIFTLVMEVFTLILQNHISKDAKCKDLKISHLCFADDLLVLCHGDLNSVKVVKRALDMFSSISGLNPNIGKSTFFSNVKDQVKNDILDILPFKIGSLSVSYLGVPLITKHLTYTDCKGLIDKVKIKVNGWKNKLLSFSRRLQLISSILSSMQVYWASVFILPKSVVKDRKNYMDRPCGKAKVAWKQVCKPKDEGGLGIKDLSSWNEVLMSKHLWNVASMKESLWVKCINVIRLKGKSIWDIEYHKISSHGWWGPVPLINSIPKEAICQVGLDPNSKIKDMISASQWIWPSERSNSFCNKLPIIVPSLNDEAKDLFLWETNDGKCYNFSTSRA
ncbi:RNA-directed DNA polymerase, eukaryota, reverse transcriptase zinc-binding domain protein [Tanacetum coccineum]